MVHKILARCALCVSSVALLVACVACDEEPDPVARPHPLDGLPDASVQAEGGGPRLSIGGNIAYQPPFLPIFFSLDTTGKVSFRASQKIVTPLGTITISGGVAVTPNGKKLSPEAVDVTQLIICRVGSHQQKCDAYQISSGRTMRIDMNGHFLEMVSRNRITIDADPGSTITVTDVGPPESADARGPAQVAVKKLHFYVTSPETFVDLESDYGGTTTDISYDHMTGELKPIHGAKVSRVTRYNEAQWDKRPEGFFVWKDRPVPGEYLPGEDECKKTRPQDWSDTFGADGLKGYAVVACIKTAEYDLGYLVIRPESGKPVGYYVYSHVWVR